MRESQEVTPRVVYWNNIPAPYMVDRFNAVAQRGNLEFEAWFSTRTEAGRSWRVDETTWQFAYRYLPNPSRRRDAFALPWRVVGSDVPDVFVSLYAAPSYVLGSTIARRRGSRTALWVESTFDAWVTRRPWKEALKRKLFPRAHGILTPGHDGRAFALKYGATPDRIFIVPHLIDFERYSSRGSLEARERQRLRDELGICGVAFVYVGRLWKGKGLGYLLDAFATVQRDSEVEVSLLLVGDGACEDHLRAYCSQLALRNVIFTGFKDADEVARLFGASDVFVFPTLGDTFGMAVSEAMACSLPVVATRSSGEITDRVEHGRNGFLVPPADSTTLGNAMRLLAEDSDLREEMGAISRSKVVGQSADAWAVAFEDAVWNLLRLPRAEGRRASRRRAAT